MNSRLSVTLTTACHINGWCTQRILTWDTNGKIAAGGTGPAGYVIVRGLARGVDAATHFAALDTNTIAVQAGSVDIMYPA